MQTHPPKRCAKCVTVLDSEEELWLRGRQLPTLPPSFLCLASSCVMMPAEVVRTIIPNCVHRSADQRPILPSQRHAAHLHLQALHLLPLRRRSSRQQGRPTKMKAADIARLPV